MRNLLKALLVVCLLAPLRPMLAQEEGPPVPVEKAAYHWPVFSNDYVMVLRVYIPARQGLELPHPFDSTRSACWSRPAPTRARSTARQPSPRAKAGTRGSVGFTAYSKKTFTHRSTNMADDAVPQHRRRAAQAAARQLHAAGARRSGLRAAVRQRARARWRLAARAGAIGRPITQTRAGAAGRHRRRRDRRDRPGRDRPRPGAAARRLLLAGSRRDPRDPQQRHDQIKSSNSS